MKRSNLASICSAFVIIFFLGGCSSVEHAISSHDATDEFRRSVDSVLADPIFMPAQAAVKIVSLNNGDVLYDRDSKLLLRPGSNMKLLTTAAALSVLGNSFQLLTELYADTTIVDSVLEGSIYFKGFGDPDFTTAQLADLVEQLKLRGISKIEGRIVGDASYFDDKHWGTGWMWDDEPFGFAAYNSALSINRNCVEVHVMPGKIPGDSVQVTIAPATSYVTVENDGITGPDDVTNTLKISRKFEERLNTITINGVLRCNAPEQVEMVSVLSPEMYFLTLAKEELQREHISFDSTLALGPIPTSARLVAEHVQPVDSMITFMDKESDNLSAENTLKIIGAEKFGPPGSTANGISLVKRVLSSFGIDSTHFLQVDGSGVSHYNLVTPEIFVQLLEGVYRNKDVYDSFYNSLPIAGVDGLLKDRMKNTAAENNLRAKTGTLSGVSTLAGYVRTKDGELLAFSIMMQNFIGSTAPFRKAEDSIGVLMANLAGRR
jgi:serine-type D-Ala-D-Ala carboxypeptidase/endopeptidase (penicillin-binding protein 4)